MPLEPDRPPERHTVPYATPAARKTPRWVWWRVGGAGALVLLVLVPPMLGMLLYSLQSQPQSATPATAAGGPAPATAPAATGPADGR